MPTSYNSYRFNKSGDFHKAGKNIMITMALAEPVPWRIATSIQEITDCFSVMKELRSNLELGDFITQVQRQQQQSDYRLVYLQVGD